MTGEFCTEKQLLIQAELDGELDAADVAALAMHVRDCAECAALRADLLALSARVRKEATRFKAPSCGS